MDDTLQKHSTAAIDDRKTYDEILLKLRLKINMKQIHVKRINTYFIL